jgi:hypothetical protein
MKVAKIDWKTGEVVHHYDSVTQAARLNLISTSTIYRAIKGDGNGGGWIWVNLPEEAAGKNFSGRK